MQGCAQRVIQRRFFKVRADLFARTFQIGVNQQLEFYVIRDRGSQIARIDAAKLRGIGFHPQAIVNEVEIDILFSQRGPVWLEGEDGVTYRDKNLELPFIMLIGEQVRVAAIHYRCVFSLASLNGAAEIIHQLFAHQVLRKIAPRLRCIAGVCPRQDAQPGLIALRLQVAEVPCAAYPFCLHINIATIKHETVLILDPVKRGNPFFDFQRLAEHQIVRHFRLTH